MWPNCQVKDRGDMVTLLEKNVWRPCTGREGAIPPPTHKGVLLAKQRSEPRFAAVRRPDPYPTRRTHAVGRRSESKDTAEARRA